MIVQISFFLSLTILILLIDKIIKEQFQINMLILLTSVLFSFIYKTYLSYAPVTEGNLYFFNFINRVKYNSYLLIDDLLKIFDDGLQAINIEKFIKKSVIFKSEKKEPLGRTGRKFVIK